MDSLAMTKVDVPLNGDQLVGHDRGLRRFNDWLLALPAQSCCIVNEADGRVECSGRVGGTLAAAGRFDAAAALVGLDRGNQDSRQARLTVGFDGEAQRQLLWIVTPVEADPPGLRLQVSLLAGSAEPGLGLVQRLELALADATTRHSTTQPLTALSFLLENLLYAFIESTPDEDYLAAKRTDLVDQVERLALVLSDAGVLPVVR